jgi:hypothetical protein
MSKSPRMRRTLPEVMRTASQLSCRSVHDITQWDSIGCSRARRSLYTFYFLYFSTKYFAERGRGGAGRLRAGQGRCKRFQRSGALNEVPPSGSLASDAG